MVDPAPPRKQSCSAAGPSVLILKLGLRRCLALTLSIGAETFCVREPRAALLTKGKHLAPGFALQH
jgi:hypothetical protein